MNYLDSRGRPAQVGAEVGRGGEAVIYRLQNQPGALAKIFTPEPRPNYEMKLGWMVAHPPENPTAHLQHPSLAWPEILLYDTNRKLRGYRMPHIEHAVPLLEVFNPRRRAEKLPGFDRRYLHRTAHNLAAALSALHHDGYVAGDLNESNVLVTSTALVTIIDTDSFQVTEQRNGTQIVYPCPVGKLEYTPPELHGKPLANVTRTPDHDAFALAVLIFQLLMEGSHPFRALWLAPGEPPPLEKRIEMGAFPYVADPTHPVAPPKNAPGLDTLHPHLAELFRRCFLHGQRSPRWRPGPDLWARALSEAEKALVCCSEGHWFSSHLSGCPYCALQRKQPNAATARPVQEGKHAWAEPPFQRQGTASARPAPKPGQPKRSQTRGGLGGPFGWPGRAVPAGAPAGYGGSGTAAVLRNRPGLRTAALKSSLRTILTKSVRYGIGQGALAGAAPAALLGLFNWLSGSPLDWTLLLTFSGIAGGVVRGWKPGYRLARLVDQYVGWKRFWEVLGALIGAAIGTTFGLIGAMAVFPLFLGFFLGLYLGQYAGGKLWQFGNQLGWERIGGSVMAFFAGGFGFGLARLANQLGLNALGARLAVDLLPFAGDGPFWYPIIWLLAGAFGGALFGALSGWFVDLAGRFSRLTD